MHTRLIRNHYLSPLHRNCNSSCWTVEENFLPDQVNDLCCKCSIKLLSTWYVLIVSNYSLVLLSSCLFSSLKSMSKIFLALFFFPNAINYSLKQHELDPMVTRSLQSAFWPCFRNIWIFQIVCISHQSGIRKGKRRVENKLSLNGGKTNAMLTQAFNI